MHSIVKQLVIVFRSGASTLSRIGDKWSEICDQMVLYKYPKAVKVKAVYTSQHCNRGYCVSAESRKTFCEFRCMSCGHTDHVDLNAAANIFASRNWDTYTARSVQVTDPYYPRNGYKNCRLTGSIVYNSRLSIPCSKALTVQAIIDVENGLIDTVYSKGRQWPCGKH